MLRFLPGVRTREHGGGTQEHWGRAGTDGVRRKWGATSSVLDLLPRCPLCTACGTCRFVVPGHGPSPLLSACGLAVLWPLLFHSLYCPMISVVPWPLLSMASIVPWPLPLPGLYCPVASATPCPLLSLVSIVPWPLLSHGLCCPVASHTWFYIDCLNYGVRPPVLLALPHPSCVVLGALLASSELQSFYLYNKEKHRAVMGLSCTGSRRVCGEVPRAQQELHRHLLFLFPLVCDHHLLLLSAGLLASFPGL